MKKEVVREFIRRTFFEPTVDPFFQGGRTFQLKQPFRAIDQAIVDLKRCRKPTKSRDKWIEDFSEG